MRYKKTVVVILSTVLTSALAGCADTKSDGAGNNEDDPSSVSIALSNQENQSYLPLILADRMGFFKKQGLKVHLKNLKESSQASNALLSNDAQAMVGFYDHTLDLQAKGKQTQSVLQLLQAPGMVAMARKHSGVRSPGDYEGKTVGVTGLGSSTDYLAKYLAVRNGADPKKVHRSAVAAGSTFVGAFENDRVDAGVTTEPTVSTIQAKRLGGITDDMRTVAGTKSALGGPYPGTGMMVQNSWAKSHKATVQKMVTAMYQTLQWMGEHSAQQVVKNVPADFYKGPGRARYTQALDNEMGMYSPTGKMPSGGPQRVQRILSAIDPAVQGHRIELAKTYADAFVQKATKDKARGSQ